ncbi:subtilisin-like protein [Rhizodiscina lignyota]|uniref:tripeptidyl-peptidase II n=1 Tax=Rhizodiscina lignyota TaxID=1504668 RepID=A0A9P4IN53_9PEZI|nr:subtilisin-like protein [Rhizodiscina lignyota]
MRFLSISSLVAVAQAASLWKPEARSTYALKEAHNVPRQWTRVGPAPKDHIINLQIGLKQSQFEDLERHLYEVSDPTHERYGQHLTADEVNELVKPTDYTLNSVLEWLLGAGIGAEKLSYTPAKDWIKVALPVDEVERLLDTDYSVYMHQEEGHYLVRTPKWSLPLHLHEHIEAIQPTNAFMRPESQGRTLKPIAPEHASTAAFKAHYGSPSYPDVSKVCNASLVTPTCLRTLYGTINYKPQAAGKNKIALNNFLGEVQARSDVGKFLAQFRPDAKGAEDKFKNVIIADAAPDLEFLNTTQITAQTGLEGSLDAETIIGITYPTPLIAYSTGGSPPFVPDLATTTDTNEPYLVWVQYVLGLKDSELPQTVSTSYGDDEQTVPESYAKKVCSLLAQLGARGVTSLHSSGDSGVGSNGTCKSNDGKNTTQFLPAFPASCPYVTTVGGVMDFAPEVAAFDPRNGFASGGGFSNYFPVPSYQASTVKSYVASLKGEFDGLYNKGGRAYPDISAQSVAFAVEWNGTVVRLDGTSAACPTAASVISLLNDALIAAGKKPLGFLNPLLYKSLHSGFHDVTSGSAIGCSETGNPLGFPAKKGWDAVTGWGSPDFPALKDLLLGKKKRSDYKPRGARQ